MVAVHNGEGGVVQTFSPQSYAFLSPGLNGCTLTKHALFACLLFSGLLFFSFFLKVVEGAERCLCESMIRIRS